MEPFELTINRSDLGKNSVLLDVVSPNHSLLILSDPKTDWWQIALKYITFGLFKPLYTYSVELINKNKND